MELKKELEILIPDLNVKKVNIHEKNDIFFEN